MDAVRQVEDVNGIPPRLGAACSGFKVTMCYTSRQITDPANVTHLCLDGIWYRLYLEAATVFWRSDGEPQCPTNRDMVSGLLLNDLSDNSFVVGQVLSSIEYGIRNGLTFAKLYFVGGIALTVEHNNASCATAWCVES